MACKRLCFSRKTDTSSTHTWTETHPVLNRLETQDITLASPSLEQPNLKFIKAKFVESFIIIFQVIRGFTV